MLGPWQSEARQVHESICHQEAPGPKAEAEADHNHQHLHHQHPHLHERHNASFRNTYFVIAASTLLHIAMFADLAAARLS